MATHLHITTCDLGDTVLCDMCGDDYSDRTETGGILFGSKALCPSCAPKTEREAKKYREEHYIRGRCPEGMEYRRWVIDILRAGRPAVTRIIEQREGD